MELINLFLAFLGQEPVMVGAINLFTLLSFGVSGVSGTLDWVNSLRGRKPDAELFWALFLSTSFQTLRTAISEHADIACIAKRLEEKGLKKCIELSPEDVEVMFENISFDDEKVIRSYFSFLFKNLVWKLEDLGGLDQEKCSKILKEAQNNIWPTWKAYLREAYKERDSLRSYVAQQKVVLAITGEGLPVPISGHDAHYLRISAPQYLAQDILTPDEQTWRPARPDGTSSEWWTSLSDLLDKSPVFLTGPGGIGKTSFLSSLYETVAQGELNTKFSCAILLSLDTLMREPVSVSHQDNIPLADATQSILLRRIAQVTGTPGQEKGWKKVFFNQYGVLFDRPVLLMLDGLNEMKGLATPQKKNLYQQIISEINCLSNREVYSNVRVIVTSRIDRDNLLESQLSSLPGFQHMILGGVELLPEIQTFLRKNAITLSPTMRELLKRPMYCWAAMDMINSSDLPATQFQLLDYMYRRLCRQCLDNCADLSQHSCLQYLTEYFLPILAYNNWRKASVNEGSLRNQYEDFKKWIPMIVCDMQNNDVDDDTIRDQIRPAEENLSFAFQYLSQTVQLLFCDEKHTYFFCHQDYRDFLVAKYFLQRLNFMKQMPESKLWTDEKVVNTLRLNTYSTSIMHLIYQAVSFSLPPNGGENATFVTYFLWDIDWTETTLLSGHVLWFTTVYQLVDMRGIEDVSYGGSDLNTDTLHIFKPLLAYVEKDMQFIESTIRLSGRLLQNLIEILMKCCELYRSQKKIKEATDIVGATSHILLCNVDNFSLQNVVDYNEAKIIFTRFLECEEDKVHDEELRTALELLVNSTANNDNPIRYGCNTLAMLLVSPHPAIESHRVFQTFRQEYLQDRCPEVCAFWLYYDALFHDHRKDGEDWQPRMYSLRQLLYLLSDHKVCVNNLPAVRPKCLSLQDLKNLKHFNISPPKTDDPLPPPENIALIRWFLDEIRHVGGSHTQWKHYMQGLCALYQQPPDIQGAKAELLKTEHTDVRAQMLLAFLNKDSERIQYHYQRLRPQSHNLPDDIGKYCVWRYYDRDITKLYEYLLTAYPLG